MNDLGESIRLRRTSLGLSQGDLAALVRIARRPVSQSYISRIERGIIDPRYSVVRSIARALRLKPWQLVAYMDWTAGWWDTYLRLSPAKKREVQRMIKWHAERTGS